MRVRLKRLDYLELNEPLILQESHEFLREHTSQRFNAIDGSDIVFSQFNKSYPMTFASNEIVWTNAETVEDLKYFVLFASPDEPFEIEIIEEGSGGSSTGTLNCILDFSQDGEAIKIEPIFEGSDMHFVEIRLLRVE